METQVLKHNVMQARATPPMRQSTNRGKGRGRRSCNDAVESKKKAADRGGGFGVVHRGTTKNLPQPRNPSPKAMTYLRQDPGKKGRKNEKTK